ncbi:MAG: phosphate transport system permease protein PstA [Chitinophagales bacterium]|nr:MAG: phosphate transport system permease protein PstA [Chitinophagales bacterium]
MNRENLSRLYDRLFQYFGIFCTIIGLMLLAIFIIQILVTGIPRLNLEFLSGLPSRIPERAGILTAWAGTLWIFFLTALIAVPLGITAAIWLEEYAPKGMWSNLLEINIANLAGVPSVIYGILGLGLFVQIMQLGHSLLAGSLTLALLIMPIIIVTTREALKAVPRSLREASYALGATQWQTIWNQVLPAAFSSIITGIILALARAVGETAPLILVGALTYVPFVPRSPMDEFTVLPLQIFNWVSRPQQGFIINAAAAIIVLLVIVLLLNSIAVYLRLRAQKNIRW